MVPSRRQANHYQEVEIRTANPLQLIVMLYDGAIQSLHQSGERLRQGDIEGRTRAANRALAIISELQASLNFEAGGQISASLDSLYGYMSRQIFAAGAQQTDEPLAEVVSLLKTLRSAWEQLAARAQQAAAVSGLPPGADAGLLKTGTDDSVQPASLNVSC